MPSGDVDDRHALPIDHPTTERQLVPCSRVLERIGLQQISSLRFQQAVWIAIEEIVILGG